MRKIILTVMASLSLTSAASAFWPEAMDSSVEIGVGYRNDSLKWKTKSDIGGSSYGSGSGSYYGGGSYDYDESQGFLPGVRSTLDWKNLNIWEIEARGRYVTCDCIYLRGSIDYGWITSGKNTDKDHFNFGSDYGSGSNFQFAKSHSNVSGHVYDAKIAVGYQFKLCDDTFAITPLIGYSWHGQHFSDSHLKQNFYGFDDGLLANGLESARSYSYYDDYYYDGYSSGSYSDYSYSSYGKEHSRYHARWNGIFLGFDFDYTFGCCCDWTIFGTYEFHWADYHGTGKWHLRPDLINGFSHHAKNAYGQVFDIGIKWDFCDCWTVGLRGEFMWFWADHGHDRAKVVHASAGNVDFDCYVKTPLRDIQWDSAAVILDLGMVF
jgi:hypothetical protein